MIHMVWVVFFKGHDRLTLMDKFSFAVLLPRSYLSVTNTAI